LRRRAASRRHGRFDDANDACFIVRDHNGHALAYVYFENEAGQRTAANLLTQRRSAAPEVNDPIIVVYGAETPLRSPRLRDYSSALKNQALANRVVDLTPKSLR
jgi:DNA-binding LacI/PurR family transcriptional regulator